MSANHGSTPAAWTGTGIVLLGFVIAGLGLVFGTMLVFWIGVACAPIGAAVGYVMGKMGLGAQVPVDR
jgi:hypothetical protein